MKFLPNHTDYEFKFDFEVGHLVKSPCRKCEKRKKSFPECIDDCDVLDEIHSRLLETISCTRRR